MSSSVENLLAHLRSIVSSSASRETKARRVADAIRRHGKHRWVGVYDVNATEIAVVAWSGPAAPTYPRFPVDRGLSGAVASSGRTIVANDVSKDSRYLATLETTGAEMIVPIVRGSRVVGTIDIESDIKGRFTDSDRTLVEGCADAVGAIWD